MRLLDKRNGHLLWQNLKAHWLISLLVVTALALRILTWISLWPAVWFSGDSFSYVLEAVNPEPGTWRSSGYSILLLLPLRITHNLAVVTAVQHLLLIAAGVGIYLALLRYGLSKTMAALAATPMFIEAYLVSIGQQLISEPLFIVLIAFAYLLLLWKPAKPHVALCAAAGFLLGLATLTRTAGLPLIIVAAAGLLIWRVGIIRLAGFCIAAALPLGVYVSWYHSHYNRFALSETDGVFAYGGATQYVDCAKMKFPNEQLRAICPTEPLNARRNENYYVFHAEAPLQHAAPDKFSRNALAAGFAHQAIKQQPAGYVKLIWHRLTTQLGVSSPKDELLRFKPLASVPSWAAPGVQHYQPGDPNTHSLPAITKVLNDYQRFTRIPGTAYLLALIICLAGFLFGKDPHNRRLRSTILLVGSSSAALFLLPALSVAPNVRYQLPSIPLLCVGVALSIVALANRRTSVAPVTTNAETIDVTTLEAMPVDKIEEVPVAAGKVETPTDTRPSETAAGKEDPTVHS